MTKQRSLQISEMVKEVIDAVAAGKAVLVPPDGKLDFDTFKRTLKGAFGFEHGQSAQSNRDKHSGS